MEEPSKNKGGEEQQGVPARKACLCVGVFFALMLLFNGSAMYKSATELTYGKTRDFWVAVLKPLDTVSRVTRLNAVRDTAKRWMGDWLNRNPQGR